MIVTDRELTLVFERKEFRELFELRNDFAEQFLEELAPFIVFELRQVMVFQAHQVRENDGGRSGRGAVKAVANRRVDSRQRFVLDFFERREEAPELVTGVLFVFIERHGDFLPSFVRIVSFFLLFFFGSPAGEAVDIRFDNRGARSGNSLFGANSNDRRLQERAGKRLRVQNRPH